MWGPVSGIITQIAIGGEGGRYLSIGTYVTRYWVLGGTIYSIKGISTIFIVWLEKSRFSLLIHSVDLSYAL